MAARETSTEAICVDEHEPDERDERSKRQGGRNQRTTQVERNRELFLCVNLLNGINKTNGMAAWLQGCRLAARAKRLLRAHERTHSAIVERTH